VPVSFLSARPGAQFLIALSGPPGWPELAQHLLLEALALWGVGGKTSSGYGRMVRHDDTAASRPSTSSGRNSARPSFRHQRGDRITVKRIAGDAKPKFEAPDGVRGHFAGEAAPNITVGATIDVWIAAVSHDSYSLTLRQEVAAKAAAAKAGSTHGRGRKHR
jgi:hypothetical protein